MSFTAGDNLTEEYSNCCSAPMTEDGRCDKCGDGAEPLTRCDECDEPYVPNWDLHTCDSCMAEYWHNHPDPLDIAEREEREAECFGLDPPPWKGEFSWLE